MHHSTRLQYEFLNERERLQVRLKFSQQAPARRNTTEERTRSWLRLRQRDVHIRMSFPIHTDSSTLGKKVEN